MSHSKRLAALVAILLTTATTNARDESAPTTKTERVVDVIHGTRVDDPYRWLEDAQNKDVQGWAQRQTQRTRAYLDALPYRKALRAQIERYISEASPEYYSLKTAGGRMFAAYFDPKKQQPLVVVMDANVDPTTSRVVLDPNALDPSGATAHDWFVPSPDGKRLAVSLSKGGSEAGSLFVFDVDTGTQVGEVIPRVNFPTAGGDVAWSQDGMGFWYTRYPGEEIPEAERRFHQRVYFHRLGTDWKRDPLVFGEGLPRVAEIQMEYSRDASALLITVQNGDGGEFAHYVLRQNGPIAQVTQFRDGVDYAAFGPDRALYLVSERSAPRREILKLAADDYDLSRAKSIVPQAADVIPVNYFGEDSLVFAGNRMYVRYLAGGPSRLAIFQLDGRPAGEVPIPPVSAVYEVEPVGEDLLYSVDTYLVPTRVYRWSGGRSVATDLRVTSPVTFDDVEVVRVFATSKDGTRVPVNIVHKKGLRLDGSHPTLLTGYGGYGVSVMPYFLGGTRRVWFDAGGVFAIANVRGGGEYGEDWHQQGMLTRKQNVFDDFIAAGELLIKETYTRPDLLVIRGGSNGGLLMGAALTQRPELFRAVVADVGIFDMIRVERDPNGEFNTTEFGSIRDPEQFRALYAYSPYHRVSEDVRYPAVLLTTGENDGRVNPMQSRKMAARLQAATAKGRPIFFLTTGEAGHGIGSPLNVTIEELTDYMAFLLDQLGMRWPPP
jgi:prolyl oligopeptidase